MGSRKERESSEKHTPGSSEGKRKERLAPSARLVYALGKLTNLYNNVQFKGQHCAPTRSVP